MSRLNAKSECLNPRFPLVPFSSANGKPVRKLFHDGGGLYLAVHSTTAKSWLYRYSLTVDGKIKTREMGLGALADISLAEARDRAGAQRELRKKEGVADPLANREAKAQTAKAEEAKRITFKTVAERYIEANEGSWSNERHRAQWDNTLRDYAYPVIGDLSAGEITPELVLQILDPIWTAKNVTAQRLRGRIEKILDYAKVRGYREGENPARWKGHLEHALGAPKRKQDHHVALPYAELPAFMAALRAREGIAERALEFTILTCARSGETLGAIWSEIDMDAAIWTVPAERMKARIEHRVPLCDGAVAILRRVQDHAEGSDSLVFPGRGGAMGGQDRMRQVMLRMGETEATVHGFRSAFSTWGAEKTNHHFEVINTCLAHKVEDAVAAAYQRGDRFEKRRTVHDDWCRYCGPILALPAPAV